MGTLVYGGSIHPWPAFSDEVYGPHLAHRCDAVAAQFFGDEYKGVRFKDGAWELYDDDYGGFAFPIRACPFCGLDLTTLLPGGD